MRQALLLCGGEARRLRPYSYGLPKACMPFLNLPLLSLAWFYLEELKVNRFLLNSYLFNNKLKNAVDFLSLPQQTTNIYPELKPLGAAGTLYKLKSELQKTDYFFYINGDSLFFPSSKKQLLAFEDFFIKSNLKALFFCVPPKKHDLKNRGLWGDDNQDLHFVGTKQSLNDLALDNKSINPDGHTKQALNNDLALDKTFLDHKQAFDKAQKKTSKVFFKNKSLKAFQFTGLALFKSSLLEHLKPGDFDLFVDFINPLLKEGRGDIKIFLDKQGLLLEAGDKHNLLLATQLCLSALYNKGDLFNNPSSHHKKDLFNNLYDSDFKNLTKNLNSWLKNYFYRFDPKDHTVGLKNGEILSAQFNWPVLAPKSVKGLKHLELKGPAVLGPEVCFKGKSSLNNCVLGSQVHWKGDLENDILLKF